VNARRTRDPGIQELAQRGAVDSIHQVEVTLARESAYGGFVEVSIREILDPEFAGWSRTAPTVQE
jgi:hypothetical protein